MNARESDISFSVPSVIALFCWQTVHMATSLSIFGLHIEDLYV